jgi:hypothetical protein
MRIYQSGAVELKGQGQKQEALPLPSLLPLFQPDNS